MNAISVFFSWILHCFKFCFTNYHTEKLRFPRYRCLWIGHGLFSIRDHLKFILFVESVDPNSHFLFFVFMKMNYTIWQLFWNAAVFKLDCQRGIELMAELWSFLSLGNETLTFFTQNNNSVKIKLSVWGLGKLGTKKVCFKENLLTCIRDNTLI